MTDDNIDNTDNTETPVTKAKKTFTITHKEGKKVSIPEKYKAEVQGMITDGCNDCLENFIKELGL